MAAMERRQEKYLSVTDGELTIECMVKKMFKDHKRKSIDLRADKKHNYKNETQQRHSFYLCVCRLSVSIIRK